jgi:hypothetical protein
LHVLSIPPAFILSQDQTLRFDSFGYSFLTLAWLFYLLDAGLYYNGFQTIMFSRFGS